MYYGKSEKHLHHRQQHPIPTDFLTSLGDALGNKLGDFLIKVIDKLFPPDGNS